MNDNFVQDVLSGYELNNVEFFPLFKVLRDPKKRKALYSMHQLLNEHNFRNISFEEQQCECGLKRENPTTKYIRNNQDWDKKNKPTLPEKDVIKQYEKYFEGSKTPVTWEDKTYTKNWNELEKFIKDKYV